MGEVPIAGAREAVWTMLSTTHLGKAWLIGICALAVSLASAVAGQAATWRATRACWLTRLNLLGLAVFLYSRSMVSHAASDGDFSAAMLADWRHLTMISLWVGAVVVAAMLNLASPIGAPLMTAMQLRGTSNRCRRRPPSRWPALVPPACSAPGTTWAAWAR